MVGWLHLSRNCRELVEEPDLLLDLEDLQSKDEGVCPGEQSWLVQGQARSLGRGCSLD